MSVTLLYIEDDREIGSVVSGDLSDRNYVVRWLRSGEGAVEQAEGCQLAGITVLGLLLGYGTNPIPYWDIARIGLLSFGSILPVLSLQLWLSLTYSNQAVPVSIGVIISLVSLFSIYLSEWVPLVWPYLVWSSPQHVLYAGTGTLLGLLLLLPGALHCRINGTH